MIIEMLLAALIGGAIGIAELVARYRDKPLVAVLSSGGLLFVFVNVSASVIALIAITAAGWRFALPATMPPAALTVVQVMVAGLGSAIVLRVSVSPATSTASGTGPIVVLSGILRIADGELERKRGLSRLSRDDLAGLSFERDHAALAELCCHLMREFDLAEAQRFGALAAELSDRDDLTDADKLDCWGLELTRLVGERALRQAARRLRDRPRAQPRPAAAEPERPAPAPAPDDEPAMEPVGAGQIRPPSKSVPKPAPSKPSRFASGTGGRTERKPFGDL